MEFIIEGEEVEYTLMGFTQSPKWIERE